MQPQVARLPRPAHGRGAIRRGGPRYDTEQRIALGVDAQLGKRHRADREPRGASAGVVVERIERRAPQRRLLPDVVQRERAPHQPQALWRDKAIHERAVEGRRHPHGRQPLDNLQRRPAVLQRGRRWRQRQAPPGPDDSVVLVAEEVDVHLLARG